MTVKPLFLSYVTMDWCTSLCNELNKHLLQSSVFSCWCFHDNRLDMDWYRGSGVLVRTSDQRKSQTSTRASEQCDCFDGLTDTLTK